MSKVFYVFLIRPGERAMVKKAKARYSSLFRVKQKGLVGMVVFLSTPVKLSAVVVDDKIEEDTDEDPDEVDI